MSSHHGRSGPQQDRTWPTHDFSCVAHAFAHSGGSDQRQSEKVDPSLKVTALELTRAKEIRDAAGKSDLIDTNIKVPVKAHPLLPFITGPPNPATIGSLTEYDYAQAAIAIGDQDMEVILDRLYKLQAFRQEYKIYDTAEEGMTLIYKLMMIMPGYILSVDFAPRYGSYIVVFDFAAFFPQRLQSIENMRIFMGALYYIFKCLSTNLKAVRSGLVVIAECEGTTEINFDMALEEEIMHKLFSYFPFHYKECLWLNTPSVANLAYGLLKPLVTREFLATWRMGCKLDGYEGRIDTLFKMPTQIIAQEQLLYRIEKFLNERHHNEDVFELTGKMLNTATTASLQLTADEQESGPEPEETRGDAAGADENN